MRRTTTKLATISLFCVFAVIGTGVLRGESSVRQYFDLVRSKETLQKTVNSIESQNRQLSEEITRLKKSRAYAKKVLRDKYHVTDEGEQIIFFAD